MERDDSGASSINCEMVTLARESRGLTQTELADRIRTSQSRVSKVESGTLSPTDEMIDAIAAVLDYPRNFFSQKDRLYGASTSEFYHRKRASLGQKVLDRIHAQLNIRRIHIDRLARAAELPVSIPRHDPDEFNGDVEEIARAVRAMWQLPRGPVRNIVETIENAGGIVMRMRFDTNKIDAVSWWVPGDPPMFVVNEAIPADRERHTLAHELGHMVMHAVVRPEMEDEANLFAGAFLMPAEDIRSQLRGASLGSLAALKPHWRVSMASLLVRAKRVGAISDGSYEYLWKQFSMRHYRTHEPVELDFPKEQPSLFRELLDLHTGELGYGVPQLAKVLGWHEHELMSTYGVGTDKKTNLRIIT